MANIKISDLTESLTTANTDLILTSQADTSNKKVTMQNFRGGKNYITGLVLSNDTDTDHDVNITAGECKDSTNVTNISLDTEITKRIDASWAVGNDNGGMDTANVSASTLYAVWVIKRSDTGVVDALFSTSFSSPTMPTNYDYKRLLGWVLTDGSSNILGFRQHGDGRIVEFWYTARQSIASGLSQTSLTAQDVSAVFPTAGMTVLGVYLGGTSVTSAIVWSTGYDTTNVLANHIIYNTPISVGDYYAVGENIGPNFFPVNGNNTYYRVNANSMTIYGIACKILR